MRTTVALALGWQMVFAKATDPILARANRELSPRLAEWVGMVETAHRFCLSHSFLWKKAEGDDEVKVFKWTGKNDYVALCEPESISFGGGCVPPFFWGGGLPFLWRPYF